MDEAAIMDAAELAVDALMLCTHLVLLALLRPRRVAASCGAFLSTQMLRRETLSSWAVFLVLMTVSLGLPWAAPRETSAPGLRGSAVEYAIG